jgi:hypothetical protein
MSFSQSAEGSYNIARHEDAQICARGLRGSSNDYIINKKYKSLVKDILSYSKLPSYFISIDFIVHLMKFGNLLIKLNLSPTEYDYYETLKTIFIVIDPITEEIMDVPLTSIMDISNKILDVLFELVELLKINSSKETENMLLSLVPNNCETLFKILSNLDNIESLDIHFLFNNYNYLLRNNIELIQNKFLLSNDITEEINKQLFKQAIKEDIRTLLFISDYKLSYNIIKYAVQNNGLSLKYIKSIFILYLTKYKYSKQIITNIIKIAVKNNGLALQFVDIEYITDKIIEMAVQQNGLALQFVNIEYITDKIIEFAVQQNGLALQFVDIEYLTDKIIELAINNNGFALQYALHEDYMLTYNLCKLAVQKEALALLYVPHENKTIELCMIAVQSNPNTLRYVPNRIKTVELCMIAVQSNPLLLQFVDYSINYDMCKLAVQNNYCALQYVPSKFQTEEIINIAFQSNYTALKYIDKDILTDQIIDLAFQYKIKQNL